MSSTLDAVFLPAMHMLRAQAPARRPVSVSAEDVCLRAVVEGRREAAEALVAQLLPRVRTLVRYSVRADSDVDDITQEALMAILRGLPSYRGEGAFSSWADRVVGRVTIAASRRARVERNWLMRDEEEGGEEEPVCLDAHQPEDCLLRRQMELLLEQLSEEQRRVLVLHHVMGMSVPEMAEELGIPFETVRSRLRLGKAHLRELLFRQADPELALAGRPRAERRPARCA